MAYLIKNGQVVFSEQVKKADIFIKDGVIKEIGQNLDYKDCEVIDAKGLHIFPGLFDMHVHLRDPGLTYKEDIISGCEAAAAGGVTSVACMPNTSPVVDNEEILSYILHKAKQAKAKVYPIASVTKGLGGQELVNFEALSKAGAVAFSDDGRPVENARMLQNAMELADKINKRIISHAEDLSIIDGGIINKGEVSEKLSVKGMDRTSEDSVTAREIAIAAGTDTSIHIAHVSTQGSVEIIRDAKKRGVKVTAETCPHYFLLTEKELLKLDADYRMSPPLRTEKDRQAVFEGVLDGTIDCIVTDHAPHTSVEKEDFYNAPNGVVGLETSLAATLTAFYHSGSLTLPQISNLMSKRPGEILGIESGEIKEGKDADLAIVDIDKLWTVKKENLHSKARNTVFKGKEFKGKVQMTFCSGKLVYKEDNID